jgi:methyl-accepting chemotaxis protein
MAWKTKGITDSTDIKARNAITQEEVELRVTGSPLMNDQGEITGGIEVLLDVTLENQALKYSEDLLKGLNVAIMGVDNDFTIESMNPALENALGLKADDCIGKKCYDIFRQDICNTENCTIAMAWKAKGITDSTDIKARNGITQEEVELRVTGSPLMNDQGEITGGIEVLLDVTIENQMASEVERAAEQISASVEELSSSAEEVSASSENIASTQQQLSKGSAEQVMAITETQRKFGDLSKGIRNIREKVENIGQVADLIKGIASQTNMLALNAAIEAARAGEAGRGFNVVADQVRKLADESRNAVANTEEMLAEIDVISKQQESGAVEILKAIDNIATIAEESSSSTEEAASAAEEQASSMEQITSSAQSMSNIVQRLEALLEASKKGKGGGSKKRSLRQKRLKPENLEYAELNKEIIDDTVNSEDSAF